MNDCAFYRDLSPAERSQHIIGQIFWIPAYQTNTSIHVLRFADRERKSDIKNTNFQVHQKSVDTIHGSSDLYHHMPIPELKLSTNEELRVLKVKKRPALLIIRGGFHTRKYSNFVSGKGREPNPSRHVFAPIVSLKKEDGLNDYPDKFIDAIQSSDDYPEFIFLPAYSSVITNDSMAVLTDLQTHSVNCIEQTDLAVGPEFIGDALNEFWADQIMQIYS